MARILSTLVTALLVAFVPTSLQAGQFKDGQLVPILEDEVLVVTQSPRETCRTTAGNLKITSQTDRQVIVLFETAWPPKEGECRTNTPSILTQWDINHMAARYEEAGFFKRNPMVPKVPQQ